MVRHETLVLNKYLGQAPRNGAPASSSREEDDVDHVRRLVEGLAQKCSFGRSVPTLKIVWANPKKGLSETSVERFQKNFVARGITSLILPATNPPETAALAAKALVPLLPDLGHLDCSYEAHSGRKDRWNPALDGVARHRRFRSLAWRGMRLALDGHELNKFKGVTRVDLDYAVLRYQKRRDKREDGDGDGDARIFHRCRLPLERVSARSLRYRRDVTRCQRSKSKAVTQRDLIEFVRSTPSLRWFRSDLTPENVAALRRERPEVTFVS
jgi:hypothetical protein